MAIYNIFDYTEKQSSTLSSQEANKTIEKINIAEAKVGFHEDVESFRDRFFSSLGARFFFLILWIANLVWGVYILSALSLFFILSLTTFFKISFFVNFLKKYALSTKRFLVAGISLAIALFSPALGIMFACTYFLMYDKEGIEEFVPASLRAQFKEFFSHAG